MEKNQKKQEKLCGIPKYVVIIDDKWESNNKRKPCDGECEKCEKMLC